MSKYRCGKCGNVLLGAGRKGAQAHEKRRNRDIMAALKGARPDQDVDRFLDQIGSSSVADFGAEALTSMMSRGGFGSAFIVDDDRIGVHCKRCHIDYVIPGDRADAGEVILGHADRV